jgi:hypothetical protein
MVSTCSLRRFERTAAVYEGRACGRAKLVLVCVLAAGIRFGFVIAEAQKLAVSRTSVEPRGNGREQATEQPLWAIVFARRVYVSILPSIFALGGSS